MQQKHNIYYESPIGCLQITANDNSITAVNFYDDGERQEVNSNAAIENCISQLQQYFLGKLQIFTLQLSRDTGTAFQNKVWYSLQGLEYGTTASYREIAENVGNAKAVRAVGQANNKNPFSIIIPCHRVIASNGNLTGYAGGLWRKEWLLNHEQKFL
jgi:methylated-DNA-[protein]-cysteine S-methyltransferase